MEATVSFAVIPTKNKGTKMHILLRALVLLDQTERNVSGLFIDRDSFRIYLMTGRLPQSSGCAKDIKPSISAPRLEAILSLF